MSFSSSSVSAQGVDSLNYGPEPKGGVSKLALVYYKIDFTYEQRKVLENTEVELIFSVDRNGNAMLEEINGVSDPDILDSLKSRTPSLPKFYPRTVDGVKENSIFFMKFQFPRYTEGREFVHSRYLYYKEPTFDDFEYIDKSGWRMDVLFGGVLNGFMGSANRHLGMGGGMKMDLTVTGEKGFGGGIVMSFYGNRLKTEYPITSTREQNKTPMTLLIGLSGSKSMLKKDRHELMLQLEAAYALQNVTPKLNDTDEGFIQLNGFSPGIVVNYILQVGRDRFSHYYGRPALLNNFLNVHGAIRPVFYDLHAASGVMLEFGVSYRFAWHFVDSYKLKDGFFDKR